MIDRASGTTEKSTVWVEQRLVGFHRWPEAPAQQDFLASRHRHTFRVRIEILVLHEERQVEFFDLASQLRAWWGPEARELDSASCESVAREIGHEFLAQGLSVASVTVAADDEGGATVYWSAE